MRTCVYMHIHLSTTAKHTGQQRVGNWHPYYKMYSSTQNTEIESQVSTTCGQGLEKKELERRDEC